MKEEKKIKKLKFISAVFCLFLMAPLSSIQAGEVNTISAGKETIPVESINVFQETPELVVGGTEPLVISVFPWDANETISFEYESSNEEVVMVDSFGKITGISPGKADVTIRLKDLVTTSHVTVRDPLDFTVLEYRTHVEKDGWQDFVSKGELSGTTGESKRLEAIMMTMYNPHVDGGIQFQTHVQSYGWTDWAEDYEISGTEGEAKRLEAIRIQPTGEFAEYYDIYYRVHAESYGWLDWAKNGESAGTEGLAKRLEAIEIELVKKGGPAPGKTSRPFVTSNATVSYTTHVQKEGWQDYVQDGLMSGTEGKALRLEGIKIDVSDPALWGGIQYRTHVQKEGWQNWQANNAMSGTEGKALRLEAIEIKLTGAIADYYDVYYRVHAQTYGWLGWAKNGQSAGTEGLAKRLEGIEVRLVRKGKPAPGNTYRSFIKK